MHLRGTPPTRPAAGNLLAPYLTSVTCDLLLSAYQRVRAAQAQRTTAAAMEQVRDMHRLALAAREASKAALQSAPPPLQPQPPAASAEGSSSIGDDSAASGGKEPAFGEEEAPDRKVEEAVGAAVRSSSSSEGQPRSD